MITAHCLLLVAASLPLCAGVAAMASPSSAATTAHAGRLFHDTVRAAAPQSIPGAVFCAYYDLGGEGVAYHDTEEQNLGSGKLNPANGSYLNEFRMYESIDISYTKQLNDLDSPCNKVTPPLGLFYVGWNEPGEWFNLTVNAATAGTYVADVLYTSQRGAMVGIDVDWVPAGAPFVVASTFDPAEKIPWRQWHHWNVACDAFEITLPKGASVLTVHIVSGGNMNLATFAFRRKGRPRTAPGILQVKTLSSPAPAPQNLPPVRKPSASGRISARWCSAWQPRKPQ